MLPWLSDLIKGSNSSPQRNRQSGSNNNSPSHTRAGSGIAQPLAAPYTDAHIQLARTVLIRCQGEKGCGPCNNCGFCSEILENPLNGLAMLPCGHVFHERCARSCMLDGLVRCQGGQRVVDATCPLCERFIFPIKREEVVAQVSGVPGTGSDSSSSSGNGSVGPTARLGSGPGPYGMTSGSANSSANMLVDSMASLTTNTSSNTGSFVTAPSNPSTTSLSSHSTLSTTSSTTIVKDMPNQLEYTYQFGPNATWAYLAEVFNRWHELETRAELNGVGHPSWRIERQDAFLVEPESLVTAFWETHWLVYAPNPRELKLLKKPREELERLGVVRDSHPVGVELKIRERLDSVAEEVSGKAATREGLLEFLAEGFEGLLRRCYQVRYPNWSEEDCEEIVVGMLIRWVALMGVLMRVRI